MISTLNPHIEFEVDIRDYRHILEVGNYVMAFFGEMPKKLRFIGKGYTSVVFTDGRNAYIITDDYPKLQLAKKKIRDKHLPKYKIVGKYLGEKIAGLKRSSARSRYYVLKSPLYYRISTEDNKWLFNELKFANAAGHGMLAGLIQEFRDYTIPTARKEKWKRYSLLKSVLKSLIKLYNAMAYRRTETDLNIENVAEDMNGNFILLDLAFTG